MLHGASAATPSPSSPLTERWNIQMKLYNYCRNNFHTKQFATDLLSTAIGKSKKLLSELKLEGKGVFCYEFDPSFYVKRLRDILTWDCAETCTMPDVWKVFDYITTDICYKLNDEFEEIEISRTPSIYFGINCFHEGILVVTSCDEILFDISTTFLAEGINGLHS